MIQWYNLTIVLTVERFIMSCTKSISNKLKTKGFTLIELLFTVVIVAILTMIALPSINTFLVELRVNNEISELNRLLLTARNNAINLGNNVIVCPVSSKCTSNWQNEISVFVDNNGDDDYDANDTIIKVKSAIHSGDKLQYAQNSLIYTPTGVLSGGAASTPFNYCPYGYSTKSRGIVVSASGRSYVTSDTDNDNKDEDRNNNEITCI